jgi:NAD(P)H-dependent flavin oxidoreductase YrpB (nitropropane dioxygenase family)
VSDPIHGHGWVTPRLDGAVARCGGPGICKKCALEKEKLEADKKALVEEVFGKMNEELGAE